jgi:hypothetical protein
MIDDGGQSMGPSWKDRLGGVPMGRRKSLLLTVLLAVLLMFWARLFFGGHTPGTASAEGVQSQSAENAGGADATSARAAGHGTPSLAEWAQRNSTLGRNLFAIPYDQYPMDPSYDPKTNTDAKSATALADQLRERRILEENLRSEAGKLSLEGVVLGASPKAWVSGLLVGVGQPVGQTGFVVTKIEARRIFIECNGVQFELGMK